MIASGLRKTPYADLNQNFRLPPVPRLLARLLDVLGSERSDADRVAKVVQGDPALSVEILKLVNSAYYALPRPVAELRFAIAYLGLGEVGRLAMTMATVKALQPKDEEGKRALTEVWREAYMTSLAARRIIKVLPGAAQTEDLYAASLLHNLGRLVTLRCRPDDYHEVAGLAQRQGMLWTDAEREVGVTSHKLLGQHVAESWNLPKGIQRAASFHDLGDLRTLPDKGKGDPADLAICCGSLLVTQLCQPLHESVFDRVGFEIRRTLDLTDDEFLYLLGEGEEWKIRASSFMRGSNVG